MIVSKASTPARAPSEPYTSLAVVIDDDDDVRAGLSNLFRSAGQGSVAFGSPHEYLEARLPNIPSCLLLDVRMHGACGFELQSHLKRIGASIPVVFMTGHGDIAMGVRAMKAGAVDFLTKPFRDQDLLDIVAEAIDRDRRRLCAEDELNGVRCLYASLSPRQKEVMHYVVRGLLNKEIAGEMGLQEITIKIHRAKLKRKMNTRSVADLVRIAERLGLYRI